MALDGKSGGGKSFVSGGGDVPGAAFRAHFVISGKTGAKYRRNQFDMLLLQELFYCQRDRIVKMFFSAIAVVSSIIILFFPGRCRSEDLSALIKANESFVLSNQEAQFIQSLPQIEVMVDEDFLPLSFYDSKTKVFHGIAIDLFEHIAKRIGLKYQFIHKENVSWSDKVKLFYARKIDLLFPTSYTEERAEYGLFSSSYYSCYYAAIAKVSRNIEINSPSDLADYNIGVTKLTSIIPFIKNIVSSEKIIHYNNQYELYNGIKEGSIDIALRNRRVFREERFNMELFDLDTVYTIKEWPRKYSYYFIKSDENAKLVNIINRCMDGTDYRRLVEYYEKGVDELIIRYISQKQEQRQLWLILFIIAVVLIVILLYLFYYRKLSCRLSLANSKLELMNMTDALTGLSNRRHFDEVLPKEYARHARSGSWLSVIMLDIDWFKQFNDSYGHVKGDECLKQIAGVIRSCASRESDLSARYGGEEFICILPDTDIFGAVSIAQEIRQGVIALAVPHKSSDSGQCVTVSLGVATAKCSADESSMHIIAMADAMLYKAKSCGRNRVESVS